MTKDYVFNGMYLSYSILFFFKKILISDKASLSTTKAIQLKSTALL